MYNDSFFLKKFKKVRIKRLHVKHKLKIFIKKSNFFFFLKINFSEEKYDLKKKFFKLNWKWFDFYYLFLIIVKFYFKKKINE